MPNAISTALKGEIFLNKVFEGFVAGLMSVSAFASNLSPKSSDRGSSVKVITVGDQDGAIDFEGSYTQQDQDIGSVEVALDKHKFVSWGLSDKEIIENEGINLETVAYRKGYKLAKAVFQDILSSITASNYGDTAADKITIAAANWDEDDMVDLRTALKNKGIPAAMASAVLGTDYTGGLLKSLNDAAKAGSTDPLREGIVGRIAGLQTYESDLIPANSENLGGFACAPDALGVAMRYLAPQDNHDYSEAYPMTDEATGITLGVRKWYDRDAGTSKVVMEALYGYKPIDGSALVRILSA